MNKLSLLLAAATLVGGCAEIPNTADYIACAGSEKYKVCHRPKYCKESAVLIEDHIHNGKILRTEEEDCKD